MALLWIDGFEGYGGVGTTPSYMDVRYASAPSTNATIQAGRVEGYCLRQISTNALITPALTQDPTLTVGCAYKFSQAGAYGSVYFYNNGTSGINVTFNYTESTIVTSRGGTTIDTTTLTRAFLSNMWYYFEVKVYCHNTEGTVEVRINGTTVVLLTNIDTRRGNDAFHNIVRFYLNYIYLDDLYICDGSGTLNDFQGVCWVSAVLPNADTLTIEFTPYSGTAHYAMVDENPPNTTDYVSSSTQGQTDLYAYLSLYGPDTIIGLQVATIVLLIAGMSAILEIPIISNGVTELGPDFQITSASYKDSRHISTTDPYTGLPWTIANLTAAQIGIRIM